MSLGFLALACSRDVPASPPSHVADCAAFLAAAKAIPGLPTGLLSDRFGYAAGAFLDYGMFWCAEASPAAVFHSKDHADRELQLRLFKVATIRKELEKVAPPVEPQYQATIDAYSNLAERFLCPGWRVKAYKRDDSLPEFEPEVVRIRCE